MADQTIQASENMIGANHPTLPDTLNRLTLVEHNTDGTHHSPLAVNITGASATCSGNAVTATIAATVGLRDCLAYSLGTQTLTAGTTNIAFYNTLYDSGGMAPQASSGYTRMVVPSGASKVILNAGITIVNPGAQSQVEVNLYANGLLTQIGGGSFGGLIGSGLSQKLSGSIHSAIYRVTPGDYFTIGVTTSSTMYADSSTNGNLWFNMIVLQ